LINALVVGTAFAAGLAILVARGRVGWPPHHLLTSLYTVAGCLALVGPVVLGRSDAAGGGLGELLWMTGGLLIWVNDAAAVARGQWRSASWVTPLDHQSMGLIVLAVLLAGWRCRLIGRSWSWTNVTGWILGLFWVGLALATWVPSRLPLAAAANATR
jgi:hypothetical protein